MEFVDRFEHETAALFKFRRVPYILQVPLAGSGVGSHKGELSDGAEYVVFEWAEDGLDNYCRRGRLAAPADVARYVLQTATALDHIHRSGWSHRDIKPSSLRLLDGDVRIGDFGLARHHNDGSITEYKDRPVGTLAYLDPDSRPDPERGDRYALALTAYEALTGTGPYGPPAERLSEAEWAARHRYATRTRPSRHNPVLKKKTDQVFARALAKSERDRRERLAALVTRDPTRRYSSAVEFASALGEALIADGVITAAQWSSIEGGIQKPRSSDRHDRADDENTSPGMRRRLGTLVTLGALAAVIIVLVAANGALDSDDAGAGGDLPPHEPTTTTTPQDGGGTTSPSPKPSNSPDPVPTKAERERQKARESSETITARVKAERKRMNAVLNRMFYGPNHYVFTETFKEDRRNINRQFAAALVDAGRTGTTKRSKDARGRAMKLYVRSKRQREAWEYALDHGVHPWFHNSDEPQIQKQPYVP
jgi:serine/threonine protein kinase